jgi:hypothetical protein
MKARVAKDSSWQKWQLKDGQTLQKQEGERSKSESQQE